MKTDGKKVVSINRRYFSGACNGCGELYEAQSRTDDLSGTKFKCKHLFCSGKVELETTAATTSIRRRFC